MSTLQFPNDKLDAGSVYDVNLGKTQEEINEAGGAYDIYPTGDDTIRNDEIAAIISAKRTCRLAPGTYYINSLTGSNGFSLIGAGVEKTKLVFKAAENSENAPWYAIRLKADSYIGNLTLEAFRSDGSEYKPLSEDYTKGIHGIAIGSYAALETGDYRCRIENVLVKNFTGCGVFVRHVGKAPSGAVLTSVRAESCCCGIYFGEHAEYSEAVACSSYHCYTGIVIMGGNNIVSASYFSSCEIGINLREEDDYNKNGTSNDGHGMIVGCKVTHSGYISKPDGASDSAAYGYAFKRGSQSSNFIVIGCILGGAIKFDPSGHNFLFSGCTIKGNGAITIDTCTVTMIGCTFEENPRLISISNGGCLRRRNCFLFGKQVQGSTALDLADVYTTYRPSSEGESSEISWEQGGYSFSTGNPSESGNLHNKRIRSSEFIANPNGATIYFDIPDGWGGYLTFYNAASAEAYTKSTEMLESGSHDVTITDPYLHVTLYKTGNPEITPADFTSTEPVITIAATT